MELQLKIWGQTFFPRVVELAGDIFCLDKTGSLKTRAPNPVALRINRQSRCETLRFYTPHSPQQ
jgi:hypothetical protein